MEKWKNSSKGLNKLLDSQLNANDKAGLGHDGAKESKVSETITSVEDDEIMVKPKEVTKIIKPSFEKIESVNAKNETVRQAENPRKNNKRPRAVESLQAVETLQWENILTVGNSSNSRNHSTNSGNPLAFYS
ncbi:hypothetical protein Tco_1171885 [Tanacetum coccineum]